MSEEINPRVKFLSEYEKSPVQVNTNDATHVRVALDDFLVTYLKDVHNFKISNVETDIQLILSFILNSLAAVTVWLSYKLKFQQAKLYIGILSAIYLTVTGCFNVYYWLFRKMSLVNGTVGKSKNYLRIITAFTNANPKYLVEIELFSKLPSKGKGCCASCFSCKPSNSVKLEYSVEEWIREDGQLEAEQFACTIDKMISDIELKKSQ